MNACNKRNEGEHVTFHLSGRTEFWIALLHLLGGHNALNLTATTVYLLAAVTFMFLEELMANQFAIQELSTWISTPYIDIECVSNCGFVGISLEPPPDPNVEKVLPKKHFFTMALYYSAHITLFWKLCQELHAQDSLFFLCAFIMCSCIEWYVYLHVGNCL